MNITFNKKNLVVSGLMVAALSQVLVGCGGGGIAGIDPGVSSAVRSTGEMDVTIGWPSGRSIPDNATRIEIMAMDASRTTTKTATLARPATKATLSGLPAGDVILQARAYDSTGALLASGESTMRIAAGSKSKTKVDMNDVPVPIAEGRYIQNGTISTDPAEPGIIKITLNALINRTDGTPVTGLGLSNFKVFEDEIAKKLESVTQTNSSGLTDVAFIVDTTGSMNGTIDGVRESVLAFSQSLAASGQDIKMGGVAFGDEVRDSIELTNATAFRDWASTLSAYGGDDWAENPLDAIKKAMTDFAWRPGAQRVILVITDAPIHEDNWITTRSLDSIRSEMSNSYIVHTVSYDGTRSMGRKGNDGKPIRATGRATDRDISILAKATGGLDLKLPWDGYVDLEKLPIKDTILAGYTIKFRSHPALPTVNRNIRLSVVESGSAVADQVFVGKY